ncbi:putative DNA-binding domain [Bonamia ostreae]|uniref:DNA-binding domain n=1 Tax=Bonamia ostreae TaxID=126728 RepID=A0ABV2AH85_9EUKA
MTMFNAVQMEPLNRSLKIPRTRGNVADLSKNFFYRHDIYPSDESRFIEFKALTKATHLAQRIMDIAEKYMVAFLNADGGKTFCGILDTGYILGLKMPRKLRDEIRLGIDSLVAQIRPAVPNDLYSVTFIPVFSRFEQIEDFYVMCLECKKGNDIYVDSKHVYFFTLERLDSQRRKCEDDECSDGTSTLAEEVGRKSTEGEA